MVVTFPNSPYELHQPFEPAGDQPEAIDKLIEGLDRRARVPDAARRHRLGQDLHDGQRHRAHRPAGARARAEQDARRAALFGVPRVLSEQRGRVLRLATTTTTSPRPTFRRATSTSRRTRSINEHIEQMRLSATKAILERPRLRDRRDGVGDLRHRRPVRVPQHDPAPAGRAIALTQRDAIKRLTEMQYTRNEVDFRRGTFRVRGDVIDIFPAEHAENAMRISLFDDEVESLQLFDPLTGHIRQKLGALHRVSVEPLRDRPAEGARRDREDQGRARAAEGVLRGADEADRGAAHRAAHALRPRDDDRDRLLQGHRELFAPPVRARSRASRRRR